MPWERPSLQTLRTQMRDRLTSSLAGAGYKADASLPRALLKIGGEVFAGGMHLLYGGLEWFSRQILPDSAEDPWLLRHAGVYRIPRLDATPWRGTLTFTGTDGTAIPSGTTATRADGAVYTTTADGEIDGADADIAAVAAVAGANGNLADGQILTLASAIPGIDSEVAVDATTVSGTNQETIAALRERVLQRLRENPQGGAAGDYERWARQVSGVFRAYCVPLARGADTVDLYFLHSLGTGYGIPTSPQVATVQGHVDALRPVTADFLAKAPTTTTVDVVLASLEPDNAGTREAVEKELNALFLAKALATAPGGGPATIYVSDFWQAITAATGVTAVDITTPNADMTPAVGEAFILGSLT